VKNDDRRVARSGSIGSLMPSAGAIVQDTKNRGFIIVVLRGTAAVLAVTLSLTLPSELLAGGQWPDGPNKEYLKNLKRPDNWKNPSRALGGGRSLSCCDVGDTVKTKFKVESGRNSELGDYPEDRWHAWINGQWVLVPPDKIAPDYAPDGTPYLFMMADTIQCFVRPRGGL